MSGNRSAGFQICLFKMRRDCARLGLIASAPPGATRSGSVERQPSALADSGVMPASLISFKTSCFEILEGGGQAWLRLDGKHEVFYESRTRYFVEVETANGMILEMHEEKKVAPFSDPVLGYRVNSEYPGHNGTQNRCPWSQGSPRAGPWTPSRTLDRTTTRRGAPSGPSRSLN